MRAIFAVLILSISQQPLLATTIHVPADQPTIQAGIDMSVPGDTVMVARGTYTWSSEGTGFENEYGWSLVR